MRPAAKRIFIEIVCYLYILLFVYAAVSKLLDFENFSIQIAQSPLLTAYTGFVAPAVIAVELILSMALIYRRSRLLALYGSAFLMMAFTVYIYLILNYSEFIPCSCGGVLEKMGWMEHLIFNASFVVLAITAIIITEHENQRPILRTGAFSLLALSAATLLVVGLFVSSENIVRKENNFTRRYLQQPLDDAKILELKYDSHYFAGADDNHIYLGDYGAPFQLTIIDKALATAKHRNIQLENASWKFRKFRFKVMGSYLYGYDGTIPVIYRGPITDSILHVMSLNDAPFSQLQVTSDNKYALVAQSRNEQKNILGVLQPGNREVVFNYNILKKQQDGIFDTDGILLWDQSAKRLTYGYFYRNSILHFDEDLNLPYQLHTIDTFSRAQVSAVKNSAGLHKMDAPPITVNRNMAVHAKVLFVESNMMGRFETRKIWDDASVVDMYSTDVQLYLGSFFVENRGKKKMSQMLPTDEYLFVLSGSKILRYRMAQAITRNFKKVEAEKPNQSRHQLKLLNHEKN